MLNFAKNASFIKLAAMLKVVVLRYVFHYRRTMKEIQGVNEENKVSLICMASKTEKQIYSETK